MTPEFPLAPLKSADATLFETSPIVLLSGISFMSSEAEAMVMDIFVPVSPSGTGKILSASTACLLFAILFAADITPSRNICPVIIK